MGYEQRTTYWNTSPFSHKSKARAKFGDENVKVYTSKFVNLYYGPWPIAPEKKPKTAMKLVCMVRACMRACVRGWLAIQPIASDVIPTHPIHQRHTHANIM